MIRLIVFSTVFALIPLRIGWCFDHQHTVWNDILKQHVVWLEGGYESRVDYNGIRKNPLPLRNYLAQLSNVSEKTFSTWKKSQRLAFLINAYNAFTIDLILTRYPDIGSIKDLGSLFTSPWKKEFFTFFSGKRHLDYIEHSRIRAKGVYNEPRIHVAVVCASVGCPALRNEAYVAERLNEQLEDSMIRFLSDKSRNRYNANSGALEVSSIFDWYEEDFSQGWHGFTTVSSVMSRYASRLSDDPSVQRRIREEKVKIKFLDYDWKLNDLASK